MDTKAASDEIDINKKYIELRSLQEKRAKEGISNEEKNRLDELLNWWIGYQDLEQD